MSIQQASPQPSAMPTASAPPVASQPNWSASGSSAAPAQTAWAGTPVPQQPQAQPAPAAPSWDSSNPWLQGFAPPAASPTQTYPSQGWAAPSAMTPQGLSQAQAGNWGQLQAQAPASPAYSAPPIFSSQPTPASPSLSQLQEQAYLAGARDQAAALQPVAAPSAAPAAAGDGYLNSISNESLEILSAFGPEAPAKLNTYATRIEDALVEAFGHQKRQAEAIVQQGTYINRVQQVLKAAAAERQGMLSILTNPDRLADYTTKFFGPEGPAPVQTPGEQARAALEAGLVQPTGGLMPYARQDELAAGPEAMAARAQAFNRPTMAMPSPGGAAANPQQVWDQFSQMMDVDPTRAYQLLDVAASNPEVLRSKVFVMEG